MSGIGFTDAQTDPRYQLSGYLADAFYASPWAQRVQDMAGGAKGLYGTDLWRDYGSSILSGLRGRDQFGGYQDPTFATEAEAKAEAARRLGMLNDGNIGAYANGELDRWKQDTANQQKDPAMGIYKALGGAFLGAAGADALGLFGNASAGSSGISATSGAGVPSIGMVDSAALAANPGIGTSFVNTMPSLAGEMGALAPAFTAGEIGGAAGGFSGSGGIAATSGAGAPSIGMVDSAALAANPGVSTSLVNTMPAAGSVAAAAPTLMDKATGLLKDQATGKLIAAGVGALTGAASGNSMPNSTTSTSQNQIDPRMAELLYGADGKGGLLNQIIAAGNTPRSAGSAAAGQAYDNFAGRFTPGDLESIRAISNDLMWSNRDAPTMQAAQSAGGGQVGAAWMTPASMQAASVNMPNAPTATMANAAQVQAPSQNNLDLSSAYQNMIYGDSAANPYLTGAIQKGINQSTNAFQNMLTDAGKAFQDNLGSIRGGAVLAGQYGGSRQGLAEGKAFDSYNTQIGRALSQFGQNNTDAAVSAQAGAFDAGQNRALSAMSGLGAQQYGVASQNAAMQQQANLANAGAANQMAGMGYQGALQGALTNAGMQQQANSANMSADNASRQYNSQLAMNRGLKFGSAEAAAEMRAIASFFALVCAASWLRCSSCAFID